MSAGGSGAARTVVTDVGTGVATDVAGGVAGGERVDLVFDGAGAPARRPAGTALAKSAAEGPTEDAADVVDGRGLLALPGFTDLYARLRQPGPSRRGTIESESRAALAAGFTRVLAAPDTEPATDAAATVERVLRLADEAGGARVLPLAALTVGLDGEAMTELATLADAGCVAASQADRPVHDTALLLEAMDYAASVDLPLVLRAQDARLGVDGCAHAGAVATRLGLAGIPVAAETIALARLLELARETGARLHVSRLSSARGAAMVAAAKAAGLPVTCDVGIHHLFHTDADLDGFDARYASAVPFRSIEDRAALRGGVIDGTIDAICSDHAPLDVDAGLAPLPQATPGLSVYDRFLPLLLALPEVAAVPLDVAVRAVTEGPARVLGRGTPTGDLVLVDPDAAPDGAAWLSAGRNSPLLGAERVEGCELRGAVRAVVVDGAVRRIR